jgi:hypothetical protein
MRDLVVAGGRFQTTNDVADAVLLYEHALRGAGTSDVVTIPIAAGGRLRSCSVVLGGTDVASEDSPPDADVLDGASEAAARIKALARRLLGASAEEIP